MNIRTRILIQTLSASLALTLVLGTVFFLAVAGIRNTALVNSSYLGDSAADISGHVFEVQLTEMINRIAQDTALILDDRLTHIENHDRISAELLADLPQIIDSIGVNRSGRLFILNREGRKMYASDGMGVTQNYLTSSNARLRSLGMSMTLGATGMTELVMEGLPVYVAYAPIESLGWSLGVAISAQEVSALTLLIENLIWRITDQTITEMDRYTLFLAGLIAFLLVLILPGIALLAVRFTHSITGPILALNNGVHEVAGGNLEREVVVKTGDELEQLAESFNMMTSQIRRHIEDIAKVTAERQRMDTELDIATRIQMSMLPHNFPPYRGRKNEFDLYAQVDPAREVGGDFFDFFFIDDDHFAIVVADVSGKGIPAALFMAISKTIIKNRLQSGEFPELALEIINRQLCDNNIMDMFVSAWLCVLEISTGRLVYINAGHNPPLVKQGDNDFTFLVSPPDLVLAGMDDTRYHSRQMQLQPGDTLFLYTDGIVEASNTEGAFYGKERLKAFLDTNADQPSRQLIPRLRTEIADFVGGAEQSDDITMLAIRIIANAASSYNSISLAADIESLDALIAFIGDELNAVGCPHLVQGQIELAAEEIFVNIVNYAYRGQEAGEAFVHCRLYSAVEKMTIALAFCDNGELFNPLEYPEPDVSLPLEERKTGGLGLLIVKKTMDTIQYSREGEANCLEFTKSWHKEEQ